MRWWVTICPFFALAYAAGGDSSAQFRVERHEITGGSELLTVFGRLPDGKTEAKFEDVPLVSVLRDTLGDGNLSNDRLRYVWVLTSASPSMLQRAASALPFYYRHARGKMPTIARFPSSIWARPPTASGRPLPDR